MCTRIILIFIFFSISKITCSQDSKSIENSGFQHCFKFQASYINPFFTEDTFERIGSIAALSGTWGYKINPYRTFAITVNSSVFIPPGNNGIETPQILPSIGLEYAFGERAALLVETGHLNNQSLGMGLTSRYYLGDPSKFYLFNNTLYQTFDVEPTDTDPEPPYSWFSVIGLGYGTPFAFGKKKNWFLGLSGAVGFKGDSNDDTKLVPNGQVVLAYKYMSLVGSYTNDVPVRGFDSYFIAIVSLDITKLYRDIANTKCTIGTKILGL
ncbi:MAG: hypothetical protein AAF600_09690 [Bacteroidota bacterium]